MRRKIVSAADAARLVGTGDTVTVAGFAGVGVPEALLVALQERFGAEAAPRDLTLVFAAGQGDGAERGLNRLSAPGLLRRAIGGGWGPVPRLARLALSGAIEAWSLPQGVISCLFRDAAAGRPGTLTHVGLGSFVDPRREGGRLNARSTERMVEVIPLGGAERLFYKAGPIDVALLRGTTADEAGNVTMEHEALLLDTLAQAMAARTSGGVVIVQVERIAARGSLPPREVVLPGGLVDAVVVAPPALHPQTYATPSSHLFAGRHRAPAEAAAPMPLDLRKIVARRCAFELPVNGLVTLGAGLPEGVAAVAAEEGLLEHVTLATEAGAIGGRPASGLDRGAAVNAEALVQQTQQADFWDGGGLDLACLGMPEVDGDGDVNASLVGERLTGAGGFVGAAQTARAVVFAGTFSADGLTAEARDGGLAILAEGRRATFHARVGQVAFAGRRAALAGRPVLYVTERAVFELTPDGLALREVAPGVDMEGEVIARMGFRPIVERVAPMDPRIFAPAAMGLAEELLHLDLDRRIALSEDGETLFLNFEKMRVRAAEDVALVRARVEAVCAPLGRRVRAVANLDGARIEDEVAAPWAAMLREMERRFHEPATRYAGSAFLRLKHGRALTEAGGAPHLYETSAAARAAPAPAPPPRTVDDRV